MRVVCISGGFLSDDVVVGRSEKLRKCVVLLRKCLCDGECVCARSSVYRKVIGFSQRVAVC